MPRLISEPTRGTAAGQPPKTIDEYVGLVNTGDGGVSVAHMRSPSGWSEPGQRPDFDEYTLVLRGALVVEHDGGRLEVAVGQAIHTAPGEWVRYSSPGPDGAEYVAVCLPAFSPDSVHREDKCPSAAVPSAASPAHPSVRPQSRAEPFERRHRRWE